MKLGFLYFAVFVLLGSEKHVNIDMRYLKLSEDLKEFQKYPWGAVSYAKTNASLLRALRANYHRVKVPQKTTHKKNIYKKKSKTTTSDRPREYHIKSFGFTLQIWAFEVFPMLVALHIVVHEKNGHIPRILQWMSNTSACFHELMSQVFENYEISYVDVQFLRPTLIDKQQPYWIWGDNDENNEEIVELFANEAKENTTTYVEVKDDEVEETTTLPSSSKGKLSSTELRTLKHEFQTTKDEWAKVASSNRVL
ncbi:unnamed protein product, partial [Prunus brigantina]